MVLLYRLPVSILIRVHPRKSAAGFLAFVARNLNSSTNHKMRKHFRAQTYLSFLLLFSLILSATPLVAQSPQRERRVSSSSKETPSPTASPTPSPFATPGQ